MHESCCRERGMVEHGALLHAPERMWCDTVASTGTTAAPPTRGFAALRACVGRISSKQASMLIGCPHAIWLLTCARPTLPLALLPPTTLPPPCSTAASVTVRSTIRRLREQIEK